MADVLGDEHEHDRQEHRQDREVGLRQVELREADPGGLFDGLEIDLSANACVGVAYEHAEEDVESADEPLE